MAYFGAMMTSQFATTTGGITGTSEPCFLIPVITQKMLWFSRRETIRTVTVIQAILLREETNMAGTSSKL